ncbi:MAG TPA: MOSC domain-containing protein [Lacipirellulaceae bacterium]|nr:MOSC domain-containing protein [Lacipirellulaceae bacterium]
MQSTFRHRSITELEHGLADVRSSPADAGLLMAIFVRPTTNERKTLESAMLTPERGIDGDRWITDSFYRLDDGQSDPRCQVSLMNYRYLLQIAGQNDNMCLAGNNLILDLDLSDASLPPGGQVAIGPDVVIEISNLSHTACSKFAGRFGTAARTFTNKVQGKSLHLRGRYARVVRGGTIRVGDAVHKIALA